jgi:membrane protease YdiL (CAAX protease family)
MKRDEYASRPCFGELVAIILAGLGHVLAEIRFSESIAQLYNVGISIAFVVYLIWRIRRTTGVLRVWGMRRDNFWPALRVQLTFGAVGVLVLISFGAATESLALPGTFWMTVALYPIWGVAQQFALQNLLARNIAGILSNPLGIAVAASILFGISHYPRLELVFLTLVAGVFFTLIYRRCPNLWAVGIAHGMLGSLAVYIVLKEDPGAAILDYVMGS